MGLVTCPPLRLPLAHPWERALCVHVLAQLRHAFPAPDAAPARRPAPHPLKPTAAVEKVLISCSGELQRVPQAEKC